MIRKECTKLVVITARIPCKDLCEKSGHGRDGKTEGSMGEGWWRLGEQLAG